MDPVLVIQTVQKICSAVTLVAAIYQGKPQRIACTCILLVNLCGILIMLVLFLSSYHTERPNWGVTSKPYGETFHQLEKKYFLNSIICMTLPKHYMTL